MEEDYPLIKKCSFSQFNAETCSVYKRNPEETSTLKLSVCNKDVSNHLRSLNVSVGSTSRGFKATTPSSSSILTEADLLCRRVGIFSTDQTLSICPLHRFKLGIDFKQKRTCAHPHHQGNGKSQRGASVAQSQCILSETGCLVPVGSGLCTKCLKLLAKIDNSKDESGNEGLQINTDVSDHTDEQPYDLRKSARQALHKNDETWCDYEDLSHTQDSLNSIPMSQISSWSEENIDTVVNDFNTAIDALSHGEISPLKFRVRSKLESLQSSTLRGVKRKAFETVDLFLDAIAPGQSSELLRMIQEPLDDNSDSTGLQQVVVNLYMESSDRFLKKQLLSMIANRHHKSKLQQLIPGLTMHAIDEARKHAKKFGAGMNVTKQEPLKRQKMDKDKLDHALDFFFDPNFHQVTAFGTKDMKMGTGQVITIPNVVRTAYHSTLIDTYLSYCQESGFEPLSKASLYKILSECPASKRTNLKGLDNIAADGNAAFDTLVDIIQDLIESDISNAAELKECKETLQSSKLYLKTDYKLHINRQDSCADHCLNYALSDETNPNLNHNCDHEHNMECAKCSDFGRAIINLKSLVSENNDLSEEKRVEIYYDIDSAEKNIIDWKSHIVRGVAQDMCRYDLFENLAEDELVLVMDWAMKFLPLMYREKQSEWFAQKGYSWHVMVCIFKDSEGNLKHITYVHVMDTAKQDWYSVACLLQHVLTTLKKQRPEVATAYIRSDNAGCYHCSNLWNCLPGLSHNTGVNIQRYDFSESQNGKSYCDAKIAHMRGKLRRHVKGGGNITSAADMKAALDSGNGVPGCHVAHVEIQPSEDIPIVRKIKGITKISNIHLHTNSSITYWRNYNVGKGQNVSTISNRFDTTLKIIADFKPPIQCYGSIKTQASATPKEDNLAFELNCPDPECNMVMRSYSDLNSHCLIGNHHYLSTHDAIKMKWKDSCFEMSKSTRRNISTCSQNPTETPLNKGWALKKDRKSPRIPDHVKKYLDKIFEDGETTGSKANPRTVAKNMRVCLDENGVKRFKPTDYLSSSKIASYFSRHAAEVRRPDITDEDDIDTTIQLINKAEALLEINLS